MSQPPLTHLHLLFLLHDPGPKFHGKLGAGRQSERQTEGVISVLVCGDYKVISLLLCDEMQQLSSLTTPELSHYESMEQFLTTLSAAPTHSHRGGRARLTGLLYISKRD